MQSNSDSQDLSTTGSTGNNADDNISSGNVGNSAYTVNFVDKSLLPLRLFSAFSYASVPVSPLTNSHRRPLRPALNRAMWLLRLPLLWISIHAAHIFSSACLLNSSRIHRISGLRYDFKIQHLPHHPEIPPRNAPMMMAAL